MHFDVKNYIIDDNFKLTLTEKYIYIYNYGKILNISDTLISIVYKNKEIKIYGSSILINKLDKREMIITGDFKKVEL